MIIWTPTVLNVLYACVLYFLYLDLFSAVEHLERRSRNTLIIIINCLCVSCYCSNCIFTL